MVIKEKDVFIGHLAEFESIFDEIDDDWVILCRESNYTEYEHFATQVQLSILSNPELSRQLSELSASTLLYEQTAKKGEEVWDELTQRNMRAEKFVVFLWSLIERALSGKVDIEERINGLLASSAYIALSSLNGSQAYCIFNHFLFQRSLEVLRLVYRLLTLNGFFGVSNKAVTKGVRQKGGRKRKHEKSSVPEEAGEESTTIEPLTPNEEMELKELTFEAMESLFVFLNKVPLSSCREGGICTANLLKSLMEIDLCEQTEVGECKRRSDFQQKRKFSDRCFALMHRLVAPRHSGAELVFSRILSPRLLLWTVENAILPPQTHPTRIMELNKNLMLQFLEIRLKTESSEDLSAALTLIENLCYRCPDRSDYRIRVADCVFQVIKMLPVHYRYKVAQFLILLGSTSRVSCRNFAVEVIPLVIRLFGTDRLELPVEEETKCDERGRKSLPDAKKSQSKLVVPDCETIEPESGRKQSETILEISGSQKENSSVFEPVQDLFLLLASSCFDKAPTVRSRAIFQLGTFLGDERLRNALPRLFANSVDGAEFTEGEGYCDSANDKNVTYPLLQALVARSEDSKASVRKAAIQTLESLFPYLGNSSDVALALDCLQKRCRDESLLIRKQSAESLSKIASKPHAFASEAVDRCWLRAVLPLIIDREQNVVKRAAELIADMVIKPLLSEDSETAWRILSIVEKEVNYSRLLFRAIVYQANENLIPEKILGPLLKIAKQKNHTNITWMLLKDFSVVFKVDPAPACEFWFSIPEEDVSNITIYVSRVIAQSCNRLNAVSRQHLLEDIEKKIFSFRFPVKHIPSVYYAFAMLYDGVGERASGLKRFKDVCEKLGAHCYRTMMDILYLPQTSTQPTQVLSLQSQEMSSCQLIRILCTMGEVIQYAPTVKVDKWFDELRLIMASDVIQHQLTSDGFQLPTPMSSRPPTRNAIAHSDNVYALNSQQTNTGYLQSCLGSAFLQKSIANICVVTREVRAEAVVIIGKICLLNLKLAKACIPIFAKQVHTNVDHLVRNNIVVVVCDLCIRYTFLVDRYSEILASCLNDESTLVRKQTLVLLTNLIKEAYVRWEGQIMYRFVSTLLDKVEEIRTYAEMCLVDVLLVQFPNMISNHFIECLFYFNCVAHRSWKTKDDKETRVSKSTVSALRGSNNKDRRMKLYKFMVKTFNDQAKLEIMKRISNEVFFATAEGVLNVGERNVCLLLEDCYDIMCLKELKLSMALETGVDGDGEEDDYPAEVVAEVKKVFAKAFRITIIDNILPGIISLKYFLQDKKHGTLSRGVCRVLRELSRDHREQLDEFLASDERLKAEIEYDLRKLEELEEKEKQRAAEERKNVTRRSLLQSMLLNKRRSEAMDSSNARLKIANISGKIEGRAVSQFGNITTAVEIVGRSDDILLCRERDLEDELIDNDKTVVAENDKALDQEEAAVCTSTDKSNRKGSHFSPVPRGSRSLFGSRTSATASEKPNEIVSSKRTMSPVFESPVQKKHSKQLSTPCLMTDKTDVLEARAISTPLHAINEVTFSVNGLSAILPSAKRKRSSKRRYEQSCS